MSSENGRRTGNNQTEPGRLARSLIRSCDRAALATRAQDDGPYSSLVMCAATLAGSPILLLSDLAEHTQNIQKDDRVSLLFDGTRHLKDPLTGPRVSVQGHAKRVDGDSCRLRFLARHLSARDYVDFGDFNFYEITIERAHLVAGFGRIEWIPAASVLLQNYDSTALAAAEPDILAHMNADHADAIQLFAALQGISGADWRMTGVDPEGVDIACDGQVSRLEFAELVHDAATARRELIRLTQSARKQVQN